VNQSASLYGSLVDFYVTGIANGPTLMETALNLSLSVLRTKYSINIVGAPMKVVPEPSSGGASSSMRGGPFWLKVAWSFLW